LSLTTFLLRCAALITACTFVTASAQAAYPERVITLVVPYTPGGAADTLARVLAARMGAKLGTTVIVDNRAGASGTIGASYVARAPADGYTVLYDATPFSINPHLFPRMPYAGSALKPLSLISLTPNVLIVKADSPFKDAKDLIAKAKASPGRLRNDQSVCPMYPPLPKQRFPATKPMSGTACCCLPARQSPSPPSFIQSWSMY
jgi:tripartite-type tricarboxylate transporter receptor subunit TctC